MLDLLLDFHLDLFFKRSCGNDLKHSWSSWVFFHIYFRCLGLQDWNGNNGGNFESQSFMGVRHPDCGWLELELEVILKGISWKQSTFLYPLKSNMDIQNCHVWKEIPNHHVYSCLVSMLDFRGVTKFLFVVKRDCLEHIETYILGRENLEKQSLYCYNYRHVRNLVGKPGCLTTSKRWFLTLRQVA